MTDQALIDCLDGVSYIVSPTGRIVSYGRQNWDRFAENNEAPDICEPDKIVGLDLLNVVQGDKVRDLYERLLNELLAGKQNGFVFGYRCDAPDLARQMRMAMTAIKVRTEVTGVLFQSIVLRSEVRPPLDIFRFRDMAEIFRRNAELPIVTLCSYCQTLEAPDNSDDPGEWCSAEDYYRRGGKSEVQISHGICPTCYQGFDKI